jgi:glutamate-1-semialdehyde 2,1-aminomutase/spore coat polysaccharide biosynthesis protein SpsF
MSERKAAAPLCVDESLRLWHEAERLIPGGSQTNSKRPGNYAFGRYPIFASRAEGARIWDVDGNEYLDFVNGLGPISLGYAYPRVDEAIRQQLDRGIISGLLWPLEVEAAQAWVEAIPCAEQVRFFKGGGEATAAAARIARAATGRHVILNAGYRGWPDTWSTGRDTAVPPDLARYVRSFRMGDLAHAEQLLKEHAGQVAAVFTDVPYDASLGKEYLSGLRDLAHAHGAPLCMDEIVHGFHLAPGGAHDHYGVLPDLACFAKGMANGMPLAAVVGRAEVMRYAADALISITYGGEALSLAACMATLGVYRDEPVLEHCWRLGQQLIDGLNAAAEAAGVPFRALGYPPISSMALDLPRERLGDAWELLLAECARHGVLLRRGGLNFITYSHTAADIAQAVAAAAEAFGALHDAGFTGDSRPSDPRRTESQQVGAMVG